MTKWTVVIGAAVVALGAGCGRDAQRDGTLSTQTLAVGGTDLTQSGVFVQGDDAIGGNKIYAFSRGSNGDLTFVGAFATGGNGSGIGIANDGQHSVVRDGNLLFVTNAGGNSPTDLNGSVSVLSIGTTSLSVIDV